MPSKPKRHTSAQTRAKISASLRRKHRHQSAATKAKIAATRKRRHTHPSEATRAKISAALRKRHAHHTISAATRAKISKALKGKHHKHGVRNRQENYIPRLGRKFSRQDHHLGRRFQHTGHILKGHRRGHLVARVRRRAPTLHSKHAGHLTRPRRHSGHLV